MYMSQRGIDDIGGLGSVVLLHTPLMLDVKTACLVDGVACSVSYVSVHLTAGVCESAPDIADDTDLRISCFPLPVADNGEFLHQ